MNYTTTTDISYAYAHVKLPTGWFLICGMTIYSYAAANSWVTMVSEKTDGVYTSEAPPDLGLTSPIYPIVTVIYALLSLLNMCL